VERFSGRSRSHFARGDGDLPLAKPVNGAMLAAKLPVSGEFRVKRTPPRSSMFAGGDCVFRAKSAADSGMKSATDSDVISAIPI